MMHSEKPHEYPSKTKCNQCDGEYEDHYYKIETNWFSKYRHIFMPVDINEERKKARHLLDGIDKKWLVEYTVELFPSETQTEIERVYR